VAAGGTQDLPLTTDSLEGKEMQGAPKSSNSSAKGASSVYSATEARKQFSHVIDAAYYGERVVVEKRGRRVAIVSMSMMETLDRLLAYEAEMEAREAEEALGEFQSQGGKTMEELVKEIDMD